MNWALFAIGVGVLSTVSVMFASSKGNASRWGKLLAAPLLIVACLNGAAPVRGFFDSSYMGYVFGLLSADRGLTVTLVAGLVLIAAIVAAHISASVRSGPALWVVSGVCAGFAIVLCVPWLMQLYIDPTANRIQLGEYATIEALPATIIIIGLLGLPFVLGSVWSARSAVVHAP